MLTKYELVEIREIKQTDFYGDVYDIEVDTDNSYNIEGVIVHNSVCTTKLNTGFSRPQFSAVLDCATNANVPIIADGGIEHNGDIAKALVAGATMVMAGGIFAGHIESPGEILTLCDEHGNEYARKKVYYGSASEHNKGHKRNIEGRKILIDLKGPVKNKYDEITQDLQSSISYAGGHCLRDLLRTKWVIVH